MAKKWRDLERGAAGGRVEDFEAPGGVVVKVRVVPLLAAADREIERAAAEYAKAQGVEVKPGDPTYERGVYAHTILRSVLDPEDGAPFFTSVEEMLDPATGLDRDRLALLFELQQQAQADFAPRIGKLTPSQYYEWLQKTAEADEGDQLPFECSPRSTQRAYHRGTAKAYLQLMREHWAVMAEAESLRSEIASLQRRSSDGPSSPAGVPSSESSATRGQPEQADRPPPAPIPSGGEASS